MGQSRWAEGVEVAQPGQVSPAMASLVQRYLWPLVRLVWRPTLRGCEHLPTAGPYLLVANHSGGIGAAEILCFLALYLRQVGRQRPLAAFALPLGFHVWPLSLAHRHLGSIPSSYAAARGALSKGVPILVFPGGDHESVRPIWHINRVDFGGRVGFLRIAREAGVPIVPMGIRGGHLTAPILVRSRWLATLLVAPRLMGVRRWGLSLLGLLGALVIATLLPVSPLARALLVWLWLGSPLTFVPWLPWTLRMQIGEPLQAADLFGDGSDGALTAALERVQAAVQRETSATPAT